MIFAIRAAWIWGASFIRMETYARAASSSAPGMSGLSAGYFFQKNAGRDARVLILDNHDDFGGHAKRNEFRHNGRLLAINGGTLNIEAPQRYSEWAKDLLHDIGIDLDRFRASNATNRELYRSLGLNGAYFFDKETWGNDQLVIRDGRGRGGEFGGGFTPDFLAKMPLSDTAKKDLLRLYDPHQPDYLPGAFFY